MKTLTKIALLSSCLMATQVQAKALFEPFPEGNATVAYDNLSPYSLGFMFNSASQKGTVTDHLNKNNKTQVSQHGTYVGLVGAVEVIPDLRVELNTRYLTSMDSVKNTKVGVSLLKDFRVNDMIRPYVGAEITHNKARIDVLTQFKDQYGIVKRSTVRGHKQNYVTYSGVAGVRFVWSGGLFLDMRYTYTEKDNFSWSTANYRADYKNGKHQYSIGLGYNF